jgi:transposase
LARKTSEGRWRFEVVETKKWAEPKHQPGAPKIGVDVGLNTIAATSDGRLIGGDIKPQFDKKNSKIKNIRANRQRQGFK